MSIMDVLLPRTPPEPKASVIHDLDKGVIKKRDLDAEKESVDRVKFMMGVWKMVEIQRNNRGQKDGV